LTVEQNKPSVKPISRLILLMGSNFALMAGSSLSPGIPAMQSEFADIPGIVFWASMILTLPALFVVISGPIVGFFTDRFGRKPVLVSSILLTGLSGSAGILLHSLVPILITRALVGFGIAGAMTATNALAADYFKDDARAKFLGDLAAFTGLGGVVFLTLGGFLSDLNWHYSFLSYTPLLILFPLALIFIHEPEEIAEHEYEALETKLEMNPEIFYIFSAIALNQLAFVTVPIYIAMYLFSLLGVGATAVGIIGGVSGIFSFIGGMLYGAISKKIRYKALNTWIFLLSGVAFLALALAKSWTLIVVGELALGFVMGLLPSNLTTWLSHEVKPLVRGRANGIYVTMMFLGNFTTSLVFTPLIRTRGLSFIYILSAVIVTVTGLAGLLVRNRKPNE
jgi:predicted MFS family arabinose efflux permease